MKGVRRRIFKVFQNANIKQIEFAKRIGVSQSYISALFNEDLDKKPSDRLIKIICSEFNVREEWLRYGTGEMFVNDEVVSLDTFSEQNGMTDLERDLFIAFMSLDREVRHQILDHFKKVFNKNEHAAAAEEEIKLKTKQYEQELRSEKSFRTSSASPIGKGEVTEDASTTRKRAAASGWDMDL